MSGRPSAARNLKDRSIVAAIRARIRALGSDFNAEVVKATQDVYRPVLGLAAVREQSDQPYGPEDRQRLDVYHSDASSGVVVYVHGGGFVGGDKRLDGSFYANVGRFLARSGFTAVLPCYRLAPQASWPAAAHDVRDAIRWTRAHLPGVSSGDVPLFIVGQSAGASHVASWLFDDASRGEPLGRVSGVVLMSGFYVARSPLSSNATAYFGADPRCYAQRSPLFHVRRTEVPLMLTVAELEPASIAGHTFELAQALSVTNGHVPRIAWFDGHNHASTVMSIGSPQDDVSSAWLGFFRSSAGGGLGS